MTARKRLEAFIRAVSLLCFFVNFFTNYLFCGGDLTDSFIRGLITLIITSLVLHFLYFIWNFAFRPGEWRVIVSGAPQQATAEPKKVETTA